MVMEETLPTHKRVYLAQIPTPNSQTSRSLKDLGSMTSTEMSTETSDAPAQCANTSCSNAGQKRCSGCSKVFYCSPECQKKHWNEHKAVCKASSPSPPAVTNGASTADDVFAKLHAEKLEIQKLFQTGDNESVVKRTEAALALAKKLPSVNGIPEIVQLCVNVSSAYLRMNKFDEAESQGNAAVMNAEIGIAERPGQPQAIELLTIALNAKGIALIAGGKAEQAQETAERALSLAESIYPKNDARLHKSLRTLALVLEKRGDFLNAEKAFFRAYTILSIASGAQTMECQMMLDELVNMLLRRGELEKAELYSRKNYKSLSEKALSGREFVFLADGAARLASVLVRKGQHADAEPLVLEALTIREQKLQPPHPLMIAYSLSQLAGVREAQGKVDEDVERLLLRALDIFGRMKGSNSPEVVNTLGQLRSVRAKRGGSSGAEEADGLDYQVTSESRPRPPGAPSAPSSGAISEDDKRIMQKLAPDDAVGRMNLAGQLFEAQRFNAAEQLLTEALAMFTAEHGPEHSNTNAAKQNLAVVRNNRIQQLWMEVAAEEVGKQLGATQAGGSSSTQADGSQQTAADNSEFRQLMKGSASSAGLTAEEQQFLSSAKAEGVSSGGCVIC